MEVFIIGYLVGAAVVCRHIFFIFPVAKSAYSALYYEDSNSLRFFEVLMAESDQYYIEQCLNGHPDEFRGLVRRYQGALSAYLGCKLGNRSLAEEAAQETFVRAYFGLSGLKKRESFCSWLLGIANRVAKEQLREAKPFAEADCLAGQVYEERKVDWELEKAIAVLPEAYREIVLLRFYAGRSCLQIAEQLEMPVGTVTKQLSRAYAKLRQFLSDEKEVQR
jgi:RNA polymerase sigma-70 factor (ECF subfamily)